MNYQKERSKLYPLGNGFVETKITDLMKDKIKYLCKCIPKEEWSGVLFYTTKGSIKDPDNFVITLEDVYLMDKGTTAFTSYELDEKLIDYRMSNPETLKMSIGHIHSHNVMPAYFSSTDDSELIDNAPHHNYYVSVVVNNYFDVVIKIAFETSPVSFIAKDEDGDEYPLTINGTDKIFFYRNGKVNLDKEIIKVDKSFAERTKFIIKQAEEKEKKRIAAINAKNKKDTVNKNVNRSGTKNLHQIFADKTDETETIGIREFILELLGQNTPLVLGHDFDKAMNNLGKFITDIDSISEYVASTISDYAELYTMTFGLTHTVEFMEDLSYVLIELEDYREHSVIENLCSALEQYAEEFENAKG